jgi:hypothetical protein
MTILLVRTQPPPVNVRDLLDEITNPTFEVEGEETEQVAGRSLLLH